MTRREQILAALVVLLIGILVGVLTVVLLDDDDDTEAGDEAVTSSTTTEPPPTTDSAPPVETTTSTTTTSATTSTTTSTTTTEAAAPSPVANANNGEILGLPVGSPIDDVIAAMTAIYGAADNDTGWNGGCPLDGGPDDHERRVDFGNLSMRFDRWDKPEQLGGWRYMRGAAGFFDADGPTPDDIVLHPGVEWGQTAAEVAAALGVETNPLDIFGLTFIGEEFVTYRAEGLDGTTPFHYVGYRNADVCE